MKHIKTYKLFESIDVNIKSDIEDIVIELTDCEIYYEIADRKYWKNNTNSEEAVIIYLRDNQMRFFTIKDIEDVILRLKDYLKDTDYSIDISIPDSDDYMTFDEFIKDFSGEELYHINIIIYYNPRISSFQRKYTAHEDFYESVHDTKEEIEEIVSTCKDILLEAQHTFGNSHVVKSYKDDKVTISCLCRMPSDVKGKVEEYKSTMDDIHARLIEYMTSQGFTYNNRGDRYTAYFDMILNKITYNISFTKELDREFIGHLRYLKKYNLLKESTEQDLKDILLELQDEGYRVLYEDDVLYAVTGEPSNIKAIVVRDVMKPSEWVELPWSELKEYALRIKDYLGDKYLGFMWRKVVNDKNSHNPYKTIELNDDTEINDRVWSFVIKYKE